MFYFRNKIKFYIFIVLAIFVGLSIPPTYSAGIAPFAPAGEGSPLPVVDIVVTQAHEGVGLESRMSSMPVCSTGESTSMENLQAALSLNLNQPAQCFSVSLKMSEAQSQIVIVRAPAYALSVRTYPTSVVVKPGPELAIPEVSSHVVLLPSSVVEYTELQASVLFGVVSIGQGAVRGGRPVQTFSLSMLNALRC